MASRLNVASFERTCQHFPSLQQWFVDLDNNPDALHEHLSQLKSTRIGIYFEALWEYYLKHAGVATLLAKNRQVRNDKKTLGEYDFIYYCHRRRCHIHLETAVKFYIGIGNDDSQSGPSAMDSWIGPACKDRLDLKYTALTERQIRLSETTEGYASLGDIDVTTVVQELALKGILFYRPEHIDAYGPVDVNSAHHRGFWFREKQFISLLGDEQTMESWYVLKRSQWCSPIQVDSIEEMLTSDKLAEFLRGYFSNENTPYTKTPIQLANMEKDDGWKEKQRYFIVAEDWNLPLASEKRSH